MPFVTYSFGVLFWSTLYALSVLQRQHNLMLAVQYGLRTFTLLWLALGASVLLVTGTLILLLYFLEFTPRKRSWWTCWGESFWATLPLVLAVLPFGIFVAWIGLITTGAWIYVRFRPQWLAWVRLGTVLTILVGGTVVGTLTIVQLLLEATKRALLQRLLGG